MLLLWGFSVMSVTASLYTDKMYCELYPDGVQITLQQEE